MPKFRAILALTASVLASSPAFAADKVDWSVCQPEITRWCASSRAQGGEEAIYQCLLKHDADLSKRCDNEAHSRYEQLTGKAR